MSNVTLAIGGRHYTVACAEGEEDHVAQLGRMIDEKLQEMGSSVGQNEVRQLLFASLLLADELHDTRNSSEPPQPGAAASPPDPEFAPALERIADRIENLAEQLEGTFGTP
jgi:cell division protein ZapA